MDYKQKGFVDGNWEYLYPATKASQVETDKDHQFVSEAQIDEFSKKTNIFIGETAPTEPKEGMIWFDTSVPTSGAPSDITETE